MGRRGAIDDVVGLPSALLTPHTVDEYLPRTLDAKLLNGLACID